MPFGPTVHRQLHNIIIHLCSGALVRPLRECERKSNLRQPQLPLSCVDVLHTPRRSFNLSARRDVLSPHSLFPVSVSCSVSNCNRRKQCK